MELKWLDKLTTLPGFYLLRSWGAVAFGVSIIQIGITSSVYEKIDTFHLGAWWLGFSICVASLAAVVANNRISVYIACILSIMAFITGVFGSTIDFYAAHAFEGIQGCTGSDGKFFYGHSFAINPTESCYSTYSFENHNCYCILSTNSTLTPFGTPSTTNNGITCLMFDGNLVQGSTSRTDACSALFTVWSPQLHAAAYFDVLATIAILVVSVLSCMVLCCPRKLRTCCRVRDEGVEAKYESLSTI